MAEQRTFFSAMVFGLALVVMLFTAGYSGAKEQDERTGSDQDAAAASVSVDPGQVSSDDESGEEAKPSLNIRFPEIILDGGEIVYNRDGLQLPDSADLEVPRIGAWVGGRFSTLFMPLSDRLEPVAQDRGLDAFEDYMFMVGVESTFGINDTFMVSPYFDTGFQSISERALGEKRRSEVNVTRLGVRMEVLMLVESIMEQASLEAPRLSLGQRMGFGKPRAGFGLEVGFGNLNVTKKGDDLFDTRTANMPFLYLVPTVAVSMPWSEYALCDLYAGYSIVSINSLSQEFYLNEKKMIDGTDFNGWVLGIEIRFGYGSIWSLMPRTKTSEP